MTKRLEQRCVLVLLVFFNAGNTTFTVALSNVARNKPASQSTTCLRHPSLTAAKAVDGDYTTSPDSCQHTADTDENDNNPTRWWMVDLQGFYEIHAVQITNRIDCCAWRLQNFDIEVFMLNPSVNVAAQQQTCYHFGGQMGRGVTSRFDCSQPIRGRYVRIQMPSAGVPMHMCEVEVLAKVAELTSTKYQRVTGQRAVSDVIRTVTSQSTLRCIECCAMDNSCNAVNVGPNSVSGRLCQLLSFGGIAQSLAMDVSKDWNFYVVIDI